MADQPAILERSYGCTFGCGNPFDYILVDVRSGETQILCLPCFVRLAADIVSAVTEPSPDDLAKWAEASAGTEAAPQSGQGAKRGRRNAPVTSDDPELFDEYNGVITADELPDEFK